MANTITASTATIPKAMTRPGCFNPDRLFDHFAYNQGCEFIDTAGALSLAVKKSVLTVSGTMAGTLAAPSFIGQRKVVTQKSGASTPAYTLTVTGMRIATQDAFLFDRTTAQLDTAPRTLVLEAGPTSSTDNTPVWDIESMTGVTVA